MQLPSLIVRNLSFLSSKGFKGGMQHNLYRPYSHAPAGTDYSVVTRGVYRYQVALRPPGTTAVSMRVGPFHDLPLPFQAKLSQTGL